MTRCQRCESTDTQRHKGLVACNACGWESFTCPDCGGTGFNRERYGNGLDSGTNPPRGFWYECRDCGNSFTLDEVTA